MVCRRLLVHAKLVLCVVCCVVCCVCAINYEAAANSKKKQFKSQPAQKTNVQTHKKKPKNWSPRSGVRAMVEYYVLSDLNLGKRDPESDDKNDVFICHSS